MIRPDPSAFVKPATLTAAGRPLIDPDLGRGAKYGYRRFTIPVRSIYSVAVPDTPPRPRTRLDLPIAELTARYLAGEGITTLAAAYGVSTNTIRSRLHGAAVAMRPPGHRRRRAA